MKIQSFIELRPVNGNKEIQKYGITEIQKCYKIAPLSSVYDGQLKIEKSQVRFT